MKPLRSRSREHRRAWGVGLAAVLALVPLAPSPALAQNEIDYRSRQSPVKNQGARGTCTAFAVTAALEAFPGMPHDLSEQLLFALAKQAGFERASIIAIAGGGTELLQEVTQPGLLFDAYAPAFRLYGLTYEELLPYSSVSLEASVALKRALPSDAKGFAEAIYSETQLTAAQRRAIKGLGKFRVLDHEVIDFYSDRAHPDRAEGQRQIAAKTTRLVEWLQSSFSDGHHAIPVGYFIDPDDWGTYHLSDRVPVITELARDAEAAGHAVTIVGYTRDLRRFLPEVDAERASKEYFLIKNSWGPHWGGLGGYGFISLDYHRSTAIQAMLVKRVGVGAAKVEQGIFQTEPFFTDADIHLRTDLAQTVGIATVDGQVRILKRRTMQLSTYFKELLDPTVSSVQYALEWRLARVEPDTRVNWGAWHRIVSPTIPAAASGSDGRDQSFGWKVGDEAFTDALVQFALGGHLRQLEIRVVAAFQRVALGVVINEAGRYYRTRWLHSPLESRDLGGDDAVKLDAETTKALLVRFP